MYVPGRGEAQRHMVAMAPTSLDLPIGFGKDGWKLASDRKFNGGPRRPAARRRHSMVISFWQLLFSKPLCTCAWTVATALPKSAHAHPGHRGPEPPVDHTEMLQVASNMSVPHQSQEIDRDRDQASAATDPTARRKSALLSLRTAVRYDPSETFVLSFGGDAAASTNNHCQSSALSVPNCSDIPDHDTAVFKHFMSLEETKVGFPLNETHLLQAASDGKLCKLQGPPKKGPAMSIVIDNVKGTQDMLAQHCDDALFHYNPSSLAIAHERIGTLMARGKLQVVPFDFDFVHAGSARRGRLWHTIAFPAQECPSRGCPGVLFLHGMLLEAFRKAPDTPWPRLWSQDTPLTRLLCASEYEKMRSIVVVPMLDNDTFPGHDYPRHILFGKSEVGWEDIMTSMYTWYGKSLDMWKWAIIPLLQHLLSKDSGVPIDPDRLHLLGHSAGGVGGIIGGLRFPDLFASVTSMSPCIETEVFHTTIFSYLDDVRKAWSRTSRQHRLRRFLLYIGEGELFSDSACLREWAYFWKELLPETHATNTQVHLRYMLNSKGTEMTHNGVTHFAWLDFEAFLWSSELSTLGVMAPFLAPEVGCPMDYTWVPLVCLLTCMVLRACWLRSTAHRKRSSAKRDCGFDLILDSQTPTASESMLLATHGIMGCQARTISSFPELVNTGGGNGLIGSDVGELVSHSEVCAHFISHAVADQLPRGLRFSISLPAGFDLACVLLSAMHNGTAAPLDPTMTTEELVAAFTQLKIQVAICASGDGAQAVRAAAAKTNVRLLYCRRDAAGGPFPILEPAEGTVPVPQPSQQWSPLDEERCVLLLRTSGTTSKGKVVPFSFQRLALAAQHNAACINLTPKDVCLSMMPLFHIAGISVNLLPSLFAGSSVILLSGAFDVGKFKAQLQRAGSCTPTWYFAVPSVHAALLSDADVGGEALQHKLRLIRSAGATLDPALGQRMVRFFDVAVTPAYGMTEACEITCPPHEYRLEREGSVGLAIECSIVIDNSKDPSSSSGEICVKGDMVMHGYEWDGPREEDPNNDCWTETGHLRTGDVGRLDKDGWLYLMGRSKEMINRGGETLSPYELEEVMLRNPDISLAVAFAAPHSSLGECVAVACVLRAGVCPREVTIGSIHADCTWHGLRLVMLPEIVVYCQQAALPTTRTKKYIRTGLAHKFGLTAEMCADGCRTFKHSTDTGSLESEPDADDGEEETLVLNSLGQLRKATRQAQLEQDMINALYGLVSINVMLKHWLPEDLSRVVMPAWAKTVFITFRSDKALMGLMFTLGGYCTATANISQNIMILGIVYLAMGWPHLFESTAGKATFQRWFLFWLVVGMGIIKLWEAVKQLGILPLRVWRALPVVFAFALAPCLSRTPDALGGYLGLPAFFVDPWHYWSIGHKVYWMGWLMVGYCYGSVVSTGIWSLIERRSCPCWMRLSCAWMAVTLAHVGQASTIEHDKQMDETLSDWPYFFDSWELYLLRVAGEWLQVICLAVAIGRGHPLLRSIGVNILATFIVHMYFNPGLSGFAQSSLFQELDFMPVFGGVLQLAVLFVYPVCFALTVGAFTWWLMLGIGNTITKIASEAQKHEIVKRIVFFFLR